MSEWSSQSCLCQLSWGQCLGSQHELFLALGLFLLVLDCCSPKLKSTWNFTAQRLGNCQPNWYSEMNSCVQYFYQQNLKLWTISDNLCPKLSPPPPFHQEVVWVHLAGISSAIAVWIFTILFLQCSKARSPLSRPRACLLCPSGTASLCTLSRFDRIFSLARVTAGGQSWVLSSCQSYKKKQVLLRLM